VDSPQADVVATTTNKPYRPFGAALHGMDNPPATGTGVNSVGLQEASGQAEKKSKYGKYGNTVCYFRLERCAHKLIQVCLRRWPTQLREASDLVLVKSLSMNNTAWKSLICPYRCGHWWWASQGDILTRLWSNFDS
jgi:hypothetical protein